MLVTRTYRAFVSKGLTATIRGQGGRKKGRREGRKEGRKEGMKE